jgi:tRNA(Phe) wybutosine-synthesizing methylase Tyw3
MATDLGAQTDLVAFHKFIGELLKQEKHNMTVEQSLEAFREYQQKLERLREKIRPALEQSARGESQPLDTESLKAEVTDSLAEKGITG